MGCNALANRKFSRRGKSLVRIYIEAVEVLNVGLNLKASREGKKTDKAFGLLQTAEVWTCGRCVGWHEGVPLAKRGGQYLISALST